MLGYCNYPTQNLSSISLCVSVFSVPLPSTFTSIIQTATMAPTILIVGATGNTGKNTVRQLSKLLKSSTTKYRIVGLTRSLDSHASKKLSQLPDVEMIEKDWTAIDTAWLKSQDVVRAYIAPHNLPSQFVDESNFHVALLQAGVKYVVKLSTNVEYVTPTHPVYYGRSHWAIENLLSQPEFKGLQWTALQPNFFSITYLASTVGWMKSYLESGKQETLTMVPAADAPVAMINPEDVGNVAAHLLALEDPSPHNNAKYVLSGPDDVTGKDIVKLVEQLLDIKVDKAEFKDMSFLSGLIATGIYPKTAMSSFMAGSEPLWQGTCALAGTPTSKEIMKLAPPKGTVAEALNAMLEE